MSMKKVILVALIAPFISTGALATGYPTTETRTDQEIISDHANGRGCQYYTSSSSCAKSREVVRLDKKTKRNMHGIGKNSRRISSNDRDISSNRYGIRSNRSSINDNTARISTLETDVALNTADLADLRDDSEYMDGVIGSMSAAIASLQFNPESDNLQLSASLGYYDGSSSQQAFAIGVGGQVADSLFVNTQLAISGEDSRSTRMLGVGVTYIFD